MSASQKFKVLGGPELSIDTLVLWVKEGVSPEVLVFRVNGLDISVYVNEIGLVRHENNKMEWWIIRGQSEFGTNRNIQIEFHTPSKTGFGFFR
jgi:hypothetical protein